MPAMRCQRGQSRISRSSMTCGPPPATPDSALDSHSLQYRPQFGLTLLMSLLIEEQLHVLLLCGWISARLRSQISATREPC